MTFPRTRLRNYPPVTRSERAADNLDGVGFFLAAVITSPLWLPFAALYGLGWLFTFVQDWWRKP